MKQEGFSNNPEAEIDQQENDQKLETLRSYRDWYEGRIGVPPYDKDQKEFTERRDFYQRQLDQYIQRKIEDEQDARGEVRYPEDIQTIEPEFFQAEGETEFLSGMIEPAELGEVQGIGRIDPPTGFPIFITDIALPRPNGVLPTNLPVRSEQRKNAQTTAINVQAPFELEAVPLPLEADLTKTNPENLEYERDSVVKKLAETQPGLNYQLELRDRAQKINLENQTVSAEEQKYWQAVFSLSNYLKRICLESPKDAPEYIGNYLAQNFRYVSHPGFGEFLETIADVGQLPIVIEELKVSHCHGLAWYAAGALRGLGIPAWVGSGKVLTSDCSQFNKNYDHAVCVFAQADGSLGYFDPTQACSIDFAYHPKVLSNQALEELDGQLASSQSDQEARQILRTFKEKTIKANQDKIDNDQNLRKEIQDDWEKASGILRMLESMAAGAITPQINSKVHLTDLPLEALPKERNLEALVKIANRLELNHHDNGVYQDMTKVERECLQDLARRCQELNYCLEFADNRSFQLFVDIQNRVFSQDRDYHLIQDDVFLEYSFIQKLTAEEIDQLFRNTKSLAFRANPNRFIAKDLSAEEIDQIRFNDKFQRVWQKWREELLIASFGSPDSFEKFDDYITHPQILYCINTQNKKVSFSRNEHLIKDMVDLQTLIMMALSEIENRQKIINKLGINLDELKNIAKIYLSSDELYTSAFKIGHLYPLAEVYELAPGEERKLAGQLFPKADWHLGQNRYGFPELGPSARQMQPGEDTRYIHWRAMAKQPDYKPMVREFESEVTGHKQEIYLDRDLIFPQTLHDYLGGVAILRSVIKKGRGAEDQLRIFQHPEGKFFNAANQPEVVTIKQLQEQIGANADLVLPELSPDQSGIYISTSRMRSAAVKYLFPNFKTICLADEPNWFFPIVKEEFVRDGLKSPDDLE